MPEPVRIAGDGRRYVGKRLLVGITYETAAGDFLSREQLHGRIVEAGEGGIVLERADTGERVSLPPMLQEAEPGEYRLWSTGEVVVDPDYFARFTWKRSASQENERPA
jgi:hypothetical protein